MFSTRRGSSFPMSTQTRILNPGALSAEGLEVDPGDFGSAVQAHRALARELAAALRAVGFHLGHFAVELAVPHIDLLDPADEFSVGAAVLLFQDRPERFGDHEELLHVALDELVLGTDVGRGPRNRFAVLATRRVHPVGGAGKKHFFNHGQKNLFSHGDVSVGTDPTQRPSPCCDEPKSGSTGPDISLIQSLVRCFGPVEWGPAIPTDDPSNAARSTAQDPDRIFLRFAYGTDP